MLDDENLIEQKLLITSIRQLKNQFAAIGIRSLWIFGSVAKGTQNASSDLDVLIDPPLTVQRTDVMRLLALTTHRNIELVNRADLMPPYEAEILNTAISVI